MSDFILYFWEHDDKCMIVRLVLFLYSSILVIWIDVGVKPWGSDAGPWLLGVTNPWVGWGAAVGQAAACPVACPALLHHGQGKGSSQGLRYAYHIGP